MARAFRIGHGYDVHRLQRGRKLLLGGVVIPYERGLAGHSDGDVLAHALINAILGAMGEGDIGMHFPDTDPRYEGISSMVLLGRVARLMRSGGFKLVNADLTVVAERPKLSPHYPAIRKTVAGALRVGSGAINVKAATAEKLGAIGAGKAIAAAAVVLLRRG